MAFDPEYLKFEDTERLASLFNNVFKNKIAVVTGHTGFKGSWLTFWLKQLGATVYGISDETPTTPSHFAALNLHESMNDLRLDIRETQNLNDVINSIEPDFLFHLAAQPIVRRAYDDPLATWQTNVIGTINVLNVLKNLKKKCVSIFITSDKCYENKEWVWGYRETDTLGGYDPYSASKAGAEIAFKSFYYSFFQNKSSPHQLMATARAGNVIGGGDWGADRIIPDCIRAWSEGKSVKLRSPNSTRPWQHVLEPISGYLSLAANLQANSQLDGESFNFGPRTGADVAVHLIVKEMSKHWIGCRYEYESASIQDKKEAGLLRLNCDKAFSSFGWSPVLNFEETIEMTTRWYVNFYSGDVSIEEYSLSDLNLFTSLATQRKLPWSL